MPKFREENFVGGFFFGELARPVDGGARFRGCHQLHFLTRLKLIGLRGGEVLMSLEH